jgi:hypothetical protein
MLKLNIKDNTNLIFCYQAGYHVNGIFPDSAPVFPDQLYAQIKNTFGLIKLFIGLIYAKNKPTFDKIVLDHLVHQIGLTKDNNTPKSININPEMFTRAVLATSFIQQLFQGFHNNNLNNNEPDINFKPSKIDILQSYSRIIYNNRLVEIEVFCRELRNINDDTRKQLLNIIEIFKQECKNNLIIIDDMKTEDEKIKSIEIFLNWLHDNGNNIIITKVREVIKNTSDCVINHFSGIIKKRLNNDIEDFKTIKDDKDTTKTPYEYYNYNAIINNNNDRKSRAAAESQRVISTTTKNLEKNRDDFYKWFNKIKTQITYKWFNGNNDEFTKLCYSYEKAHDQFIEACKNFWVLHQLSHAYPIRPQIIYDDIGSDVDKCKNNIDYYMRVNDEYNEIEPDYNKIDVVITVFPQFVLDGNIEKSIILWKEKKEEKKEE